jgi:hypothetical protein
MISICCPLCYEVYQKRAETFLALRVLRKEQGKLAHGGHTDLDG